MLTLVLALFTPAALADELVVHTPADITQMALVCDGERLERPASQGTRTADGLLAFSFPIRPGRVCALSLTRDAGSIEQVGTWKCDFAGCMRQDADPTAGITAGPSELVVVLDRGFSHNQIELTCPSGLRDRADVSGNQVRFGSVPAGAECTLNFKGGPPMRFSPIGPGVHLCHLVGSTPVCKRRN